MTGGVEIARYQCEGQPDVWLLNGAEVEDVKVVLVALSDAIGKRVVFGKTRKAKKAGE